MRIWQLGLVMVALAAPAMAAETSAISLAKTSKWEMKYNADSCQLLASFGSDKDRVIFVLTREQPGDPFDLQLYGQAFKYSGIEMPVELTFGNGGKPAKRGGIALNVNSGEKIPLVRLTGLRLDGWEDWKHPETMVPISPAREAAITTIAFKPARGKRYLLETGSMGAPMAAVRTCTEDLVKTWGYDPAIEARLQQRPVPIDSPATWLRTGDFPTPAVFQGHNGLVRFRLDIDASGMPRGCRVLYRTNPDEFADLTCQLITKRARFKPALDAQGKPVKSFYINNVRWMAAG